MENELRQLRANIQEVNEMVHQSQSETWAANDKLEQMATTVETVKHDLNQSDKRNKELCEHQEVLESEKVELSKLVEQLELGRDDLSSQLSQSQNKLNQLTNKITELDAELDQSQDKTRELTNRLSQSQAASKEASELMGQLETDSDRDVQALQKVRALKVL